MWFIGVEVEQETSAPPPKKILDPPLRLNHLYSPYRRFRASATQAKSSG